MASRSRSGSARSKLFRTPVRSRILTSRMAIVVGDTGTGGRSAAAVIAGGCARSRNTAQRGARVALGNATGTWLERTGFSLVLLIAWELAPPGGRRPGEPEARAAAARRPRCGERSPQRRCLMTARATRRAVAGREYLAALPRQRGREGPLWIDSNSERW